MFVIALLSIYFELFYYVNICSLHIYYICACLSFYRLIIIYSLNTFYFSFNCFSLLLKIIIIIT